MRCSRCLGWLMPSQDVEYPGDLSCVNCGGVVYAEAPPEWEPGKRESERVAVQPRGGGRRTA